MRVRDKTAWRVRSWRRKRLLLRVLEATQLPGESQAETQLLTEMMRDLEQSIRAQSFERRKRRRKVGGPTCT